MGVAGTIAKNTFFNFVATACDVVINLAVGIILARSLGAEQYGVYAFLMWFLSAAVLIVNLGLGEMAKRFIAEAIGRGRVDDSASVVRLSLLIRLLAAVIAGAVIFGFSAFWSSRFQGIPFHFMLVAIALLPNVLNLAFISVYSGFQKYQYGAYLLLLTNPLRLVLISVLMAKGFGVEEVLYANIGVWILGVAVGLVLLHRLMPLRELFAPISLRSDTTKTALKYATTLAGIMAVNFFLWRQAETLFLGMWVEADEVGFYTLASKIPLMVMTVVPSVLGLVLVPAISEQFGRGDMERLRRIYLLSGRYLMMLAFPLAAVGIAMAGPIVHLMYGAAEYGPVIMIMQILFVPYALMGVGHAAIGVIYGVNKPSFILKMGIVLIGLNVGLSIWLIPLYGLAGAAIGSSVPRLVALPLYILFASRQVGAQWPVGDTLRIVTASSVAGIALYFTQWWLGPIAGLALTLPVGVPLLVAMLLATRAFKAEDIDILRKLQVFSPPQFRRNYVALLDAAERIVG